MQNTARVEPCNQSAQAAGINPGEIPVRRQTTIVTVTYGDRMPYLRRLIEQAFTFEQITRVLVISNASTAPLEQLTSRWPGQVRVIPLTHNTGSANGYAVGLEAALAEGAQYIWMMDDDNAPTAAAVRLLHEELARMADEAGLHRAAVLGFRPSQQEDIARGVPRRFAIQPRSSYFGFHVAQLPYKVWRRLPWGRRHGPSTCPSHPTAACSPTAACTRRSGCHCASWCSTPTTPSTPVASPPKVAVCAW